ncbi:tetratricopeptide repeat protein [Nonomuraea sp. NPDC050451]|uniref:tetratricopeptide repeat protein n=1 Tax=Nonomuraea sp. NPDC050451 TaxID=3364364 RepID=UPI0037AE7C79
MTDHIPPDADTLVTAHLLNQSGLLVNKQGASRHAIDSFERACIAYKHVLGTDHPYTLSCRSNLASAYWSVGDLGRAIPLLEATLADRERVLGSDHPGTLASRSNLAHAYQAAGDLGRAIPLYEVTLADQERVLGVDHPTTKVVRANLSALR